MSESREHKRRYNQRLEFIAHFNSWMMREPPLWRLWMWHKWKQARPVWRDADE